MADKQVEPHADGVVCTLTIGKRAERELAWSDLAGLALTSRHVDGGLHSTFPLEVADQVEDLARKEIACCGSWLTIDHHRTSDHLSLQLTAGTEEGTALIRSFTANGD